MARYGLIEAGGTKFVLGISEYDPATGAAPQIAARHQIPTTTPAETLSAAVAWLREAAPAYDAIGIASFGPLELDRAAHNWGHVTATPKPHWTNADLVGPFAQAFGCPIAVDTDVNGAALAEARWGAGSGGAGVGANSTLYLTVGTGVGGGFVTAEGALLRGLSHPEMGHIRMPRHKDDTDFAGACPFHGNCLEGVAAGPSIIARWGQSLSKLGPDHPGHAIIAWYLGQAMCSFQAVMAPARIVLGGGVMGTPGLIEAVRCAATASGAGYFVGDPAQIIVAPGLGGNSGLLGALALTL